MIKYTIGFALLLISIIGLNSIGFSQSTYKIEDPKDAKMKLFGTSTLHKWEMFALSVSSEAQFVFKLGSQSELNELKSLSFTLAVQDLKSDNKELDKNAYKALKAVKYKYIQYNLSSTTLLQEKGGYLLKTKGNLTIAGVSKEIDMDVHVIINKNGTITCTGSKKLIMTDYNVDPPSFMFGAMKTGDAITLEFNLIYKS